MDKCRECGISRDNHYNFKQDHRFKAEPELMVAKRRLREERASGCSSPSDIAFWKAEVMRLTPVKVCKWCLNPKDHPRHDFITPGNYASAKHNFEVAR